MSNSLSIIEAIEIVKDISSLKVKFTKHAQERMEERSISSKQVYTVLSKANILDTPMYNKEHNEWRIKIEGVAAGDVIRLIVAIHCLYGNQFPLNERKCDLTIITVIYIDSI